MDLPVLPYEALVNIFAYLSHADRCAAGLACRAWHEASYNLAFQRRRRVCFAKDWRGGHAHVTDVFAAADAPLRFTSFAFREMDVAPTLAPFWRKNGAWIRCLAFDRCDLDERTFLHVLDACPNLEALAVTNCRELFMSASLVDEEGRSACARNLRQLTELNLADNRYLTDALFDRLARDVERLERLDLSDCTITFHSALHRRFYPENYAPDAGETTTTTTTPSESVLTFQYVFEFIKKHASSLKELRFNRTHLDSPTLVAIAALPDLKLTTLEAFGCQQLNLTGILRLTQLQTNLAELDLGMCCRATDEVLSTIASNMQNLKALNLRECESITDKGIVHLRKNKTLQRLDVSGCPYLSSEGISKGVCHQTNYAMTHLNASQLKLDESCVVLIAQRLPNLRVLDLSACFTAVTDAAVQEIFKNLVQLTELSLQCCEAITDAGVTGMGLRHRIGHAWDSAADKIANSEIVRRIPRIALSSRAEQEIVRDARRKREIRELCEKIEGVAEAERGYSLSRLTELRRLELSGCNKVTDVSLTYSFRNRHLTTLRMSECQQITREGLARLVAKCRAVELLDLRNCYGVDDESVRAVVERLPRLQRLYLSGCDLLTDKCINAIQSNCKSLIELDVKNCPNISPDLAYSLYAMTSVRSILVSKVETYEDEYDRFIPTAPPPKERSFFKRIFHRHSCQHV